jgi:hypothetical protein
VNDAFVGMVRIQSCDRCGAITAYTTARGGHGIDNAAAHAGWHESQDALLSLLAESSQALAHLRGNGSAASPPRHADLTGELLHRHPPYALACTFVRVQFHDMRSHHALAG